MATVTKTYSSTYTESSSYKKTWTVQYAFNDVTASDSTFSITTPTITAKFVGTTGTYRADKFEGCLIVDGKNLNWDGYISGSYTSSTFWWQDPENYDTGNTIAGSSNTFFTLTKRTSRHDTGGGLVTSPPHTVTLNTSTFFTTANSTQKTLDITFLQWVTLETGISGQLINFNTIKEQYVSPNYETAFKIGTLTLNAPPTATVGTPSYSNPQYAGLGAYTVGVTTSSAQYGGKIQSITLTIGSQTDTKNFSATTVTNQTFTLTPAVAGTFTPTITIADSRGQTTVKTLPQITVNAYTAPSMSFDLARCDVDGIPQAEGEYGLVTANITYVDAIAELTQPTVSVKDSSDSTIISSTTWYETWDAVNGVSDAVNWTNYNPTSPATLYAIVSATGSEFSPNESYTVSITPTDNMGGVAQTISQTLATGFFTIDFQAGGKEIAFGAPANDDLTDINGVDYSSVGLFKCKMGTNFNDMTAQEVDDFVDNLNVGTGGGVAVDLVVEEGTSGIWTYRKWNSGIVECWGYYSKTVSISASSHVAILPPAFPFTITNAIVNATGGGSGTPSICVTYQKILSTNDGADIYWRNLSGSAFNNTAWVYISVKGTWK